MGAALYVLVSKWPKCFRSRHPIILARAFITYVRPLLESCSPVWSPHFIKDIKQIESVQRRFTKRLYSVQHMKYIDRINCLGLERLDVRRLRADVIFTYKIIFGLTHLNMSDFFKFNTSSQFLRGHNYKLVSANCAILTVVGIFSVKEF